MPIKGLSERRQLPRIGKIRLGIKKISPKTNKEYPTAVDYFVCPPEVTAVYGEKPKSLDVIIPMEDEEIWASQYYRQYSRTRGLICKGDGETCRRMIDTKTGAIAGKETQTADWREEMPCAGRECLDYKGKACQEVMNLQFILPKVPGLGVWQIDTGSIHSIMNINNCATMIRASTPTGRVSWVPLKLTLEPTEVVNPEDPQKRKKTVYCMHLRYDGNLENLLLDSNKPRLQLIVGRPLDNEAPEDREISSHNIEKLEEVQGKAEADIDELWTETPKEDHSRLNPKEITPPKPEPKAKIEEVEKQDSPLVEEVKKMGAERVEPRINHDWFKESLTKLQEAKVAKWSGKEVLARLNIMTGGETTKALDALDLLSEEDAAELENEMQALLALL